MKTDREYRPLMCISELHSETKPAKDAHPLAKVVQIRLVRSRKVQLFLEGGIPLRMGDNVVVETERGTAHGVVVTPPSLERAPAKTLRRVLRRLDGEDARRAVKPDPEREKQAHRMGKQLIRDMRLDMKIIEVEFVPWENRVVFHFVAEERVDFRDLVKELSRLLRCRIEMRQIGPRDETKMLGGIGRCGQEYCCSSFLNEFRSVRTKMAKEQGLVVNQEKITGHCRKLLCCLAYERDMYNEMKATLPPVGTRFETPGGMARVSEQLVLRQQIRICMEETRVFKDLELAELTLNEDKQWVLAKAGGREDPDAEGEAGLSRDGTESQQRPGDGMPGQPRPPQASPDPGRGRGPDARHRKPGDPQGRPPQGRPPQGRSPQGRPPQGRPPQGQEAGRRPAPGPRPSPQTASGEGASPDRPPGGKSRRRGPRRSRSGPPDGGGQGGGGQGGGGQGGGGQGGGGQGGGGQGGGGQGGGGQGGGGQGGGGQGGGGQGGGTP